MEKIKVCIGSVVAGSSGQVNDNRRDVEFIGEQLASFTEYGEGRDGGITDTRGVTQTLFKVEDGRLVVHVKDWSHWQGEPTGYSLREVSESDLQPGGEFEALGYDAGLSGPLTLDQALQG